MTPATPGIHHVSAIAGDPQENLDFYTDVLGLRFVKQTVNQDSEFMYHLYYGDREGSPGTLLTFFPYERGEVGRVGKPQPSAVAFAVPEDAVDYWVDRLAEHGVDADEPIERFGGEARSASETASGDGPRAETVVRFRDHDGLPVELVATDGPPSPSPWREGPVPEQYAIRDLHGVTLLSSSVYHTAATLEVFGLELIAQEGDRVRYRAPGDRATVVDLLDVDAGYGKEGSGTIHHVAFRNGDTPLPEWRERLRDADADPTWIKDRTYFDAVYVREPGGILFELATSEPGMTVDESVDDLGSGLRLPPKFEADRAMLEGQLPPLRTD